MPQHLGGEQQGKGTCAGVGGQWGSLCAAVL